MESLGDAGEDAFDFQFPHAEVHLTAGSHTFSQTVKHDGYLDFDGLLLVDAEEVHVQHVVFHRVVLCVLEDCGVDFAVDVELHYIYMRSVDQFSQFVFADSDVHVLTEAVDYAGDFALFAEVLCYLFAILVAGGSVDLDSFHCFVLL